MSSSSDPADTAGPPPLGPADPIDSPTEPYSYDFPEDVAPALGTSFSHLLATTNPIQQKKTGECFGWAWQGRGKLGGGAGASGGLTRAELTVGEAEGSDRLG